MHHAGGTVGSYKLTQTTLARKKRERRRRADLGVNDSLNWPAGNGWNR
jgi:hypothetical protein